MNWKGKKVLVTGAGGFIGSHLVEGLIEKGASVRTFVHYNSRNDWGNLEQIQKEMEEIVKSLGEKTVQERTLRMQERVLSRLLDAQRSLNKRDYSKKRKSETAREYRAVSPEDIKLSENRDRLYDDLIKALNEGYNEDFMRLIRKYFHALCEQNKNTNGN